MARSRNIKPGFFENEDLADCGAYGMLLFAGLWTLSDREGRLEDRPKRIRAKVFPYFDDVDVDNVLGQLEKHGFIVRYEVEGSAYIQIVNFSKHQMPHYKEALSVIPPPEGHPQPVVVATGPTRDVRLGILERDGKCVECGCTEDLTLDHIIPRSKGGTDNEDNLQTLCRRCNSAKNNREARSLVGQSSANQGGALASDSSLLIPDSLIPDSGLPEGADAPPAQEPNVKVLLLDDPPPEPSPPPSSKLKPEVEPMPSRKKPGTPLPENFDPGDLMFAWAEKELGMRVDVIDRETDKFIDHWRGNGELKVDWIATWRNWMRRSQEGFARSRR